MSVTGNSLAGNQYEAFTTVCAIEHWRVRKNVMETMSDNDEVNFHNSTDEKIVIGYTSLLSSVLLFGLVT